jgi:hypothetical protein
MQVSDTKGFVCHGFDTRGIALTVESPYPRERIIKAQLPQISELEPFKTVL